VKEQKLEAMKIHKHVLQVIDHYIECWAENRCLHCGDCVAFALLFSEHLGPFTLQT
jgi:NADH dehydrogenase/NADH:ubiquinone oxidoreductase subunit G